ncbi:MAG TPA: glycogen/starch synthase [Longimicrobiales bacterium]|nr:glycogen/starch synthase [Longimicrobiales bacterium]
MAEDPTGAPIGETTGAPPYEAPVVHLATEYWPYARTGGLGEAVRGIARYQAEAGATTFVFLPLYAAVQLAFPQLAPAGEPYAVPIGGRVETARVFCNPECERNPRVLFIEHAGHFGREGIYGNDDGDFPDNHVRFGYFCRAALEWLPRITPGQAIIHAHDWHAALAPVYLRTLLAGDPYYDRVATVLTVHNAGYQGQYGYEALAELGLDSSLYHPDYMEWYGRVNILKGGLTLSDMVTTVSPTHAHELRTRTGGFGLHDTFNVLQDRFVGILNGIDYTVWDPATDPWIEARYDAHHLGNKARCKAWLQEAVGLPVAPDVPLFGMTARLAEQKGYDILLGTRMFHRLDAQWIFLGEGEKRYEDALSRLAREQPDRVAAFFEFTEEREHRLLAGADFLLMPSLYEPCGLTQMRAQRYGALPVVRRVGGLADTVEDRVTGFVFDEYQPWALEEAVQYAIDLYRDRDSWESHVREAMLRDFSWRAGVERYQEVYARACEVWRARSGG